MKKFLSVFLLVFSTVLHADSTKELAIKSAFIIKMAYFIEWPQESVFVRDEKPVNLCLEISRKEGKEIEEWAVSGKIKSRKVLVKYIGAKTSVFTECDILYVKTETLKEKIIKSNGIRHTLTIADIPGSAEEGILISFLEVNKKLRFEINKKKAEELGFKLNPRLLRLAIIVGSNR